MDLALVFSKESLVFPQYVYDDGPKGFPRYAYSRCRCCVVGFQNQVRQSLPVRGGSLVLCGTLNYFVEWIGE